MRLLIQTTNLPEFHAGSRTSHIKTLILSAISDRLSPLICSGATPVKVTVDFKDCIAEISKGLEYASEIGIKEAPAAVLSGYCQAAIRELSLSDKKPYGTRLTIEGPISDTPFVERREQKIFRQQIEQALGTNNIVLQEGATGLGKSHTLVTLALNSFMAGKGPAVIAAPTILVIKQLLGEWAKISAGSTARVAVVIGKNQFVDYDILSELISNPDSGVSDEGLRNVKRWLDTGARPIPGRDTEALQSVFPDVAFLIDDLIHVAPELEDFPGLELTGVINTEKGNSSEIIYQTMRESALIGDIVFVTHAMLAFHVLNVVLKRGGLLCDFNTLLVDEAHQLRSAIDNAVKQEVSILAIRHACRLIEPLLKKKRSMTDAIELCDKIIGRAKLLGTEASITISANAWKNSETPGYVGGFLADLRDLCGLLDSASAGGKSKSKKKDTTKENSEPTVSTGKKESAGTGTALKKIEEARYSIRKILACDQSLRISISPMRYYPSFQIQSTAIAPLLKQLWSMTHQAVLVSATLFLPSSSISGKNIEFIMDLLGIPKERLQAPPPVSPEWVRTPVTLHYPEIPDSGLKNHPFEYPSLGEYGNSQEEIDRYDKNVEVWRKCLADQILVIANEAKGGSLVLCASYDDLGAFANKISSEASLEDRLIIQNRSSRFGSLREEYLKMAMAGKRPVWLALGTAWTGLDLSDPSKKNDSASEDDVLTDLVIVRIPFSPSGMIQGKKKRIKGAFIQTISMTEAAFMFRQGIGRLVRKPGMANKHLWVLDPRIWTKNPKIYGVFLRVLEPYQYKKQYGYRT